MFNKPLSFLIRLVGLLTVLVLVVIACENPTVPSEQTPPSDDPSVAPNISGAYVPPSLTAGVGYDHLSSSALSISSVTSERPVVTDINEARDLFIERFGWQVWHDVGQISVGTNNFILEVERNIIERWDDKVASSTSFDFEFSGVSFEDIGIPFLFENSTIRFDSEIRNWELVISETFFGDTLRAYIRYSSDEEESRVLFVQEMVSNDGGQNRLIQEVLITEHMTYMKDMKWNNIGAEDVSPQLSHLIAVVDRRRPEQPTTARMFSEDFMDYEINTARTEQYMFEDGPGEVAGEHYSVLGTPEMNRDVHGEDDESPIISRMDIFGLFDRDNYYLLLPSEFNAAEAIEARNNDEDYSYEAQHIFPLTEENYLKEDYSHFIHPDDIRFLFEQGFTQEDWPILLDLVREGQSINFEEWNFAEASWL